MNVRTNAFETAKKLLISFASWFFALAVCLLIYTYVRSHYPANAQERMKLIQAPAPSTEGFEGAGN